MTGKDLLKGLSFVDEDLIEEAEKETLSEEKRSGKVIFLRTIISAAAGLLIFFAGTAVGSRIAVKPLHNEGQPEGVAVLGIYQSEEEQNTLYGGAGEAMPQEGMADAQSGEMSVQEGMVDAQAKNSDILSLSEDVKVGKKIESSQTQQAQGEHLPQLPVTVIGGISVYFYQEENTDGFFADFEENNVSYTLQADTLREVVQAAADAICDTDTITIID